MTQEWLEGLREFLYEMMEPFIPDDDFRAALLDEEQMPIWAAAFTHETFDQNNNYEEIELVGDRMIEAAYPLYMFSRFRNIKRITKKELTEGKNTYMAKKEQSIRGKNHGFYKWLRASSITNLKGDVNEDLYESFIGALYLTSDKLIMFEYAKKKSKFDLVENDSFRLVRRFIAYDMDKVNIEFGTPAKSMIVQSLRRIGVIFKNSEVLENFIPNNPKSATDLSGKGTIILTPAMAGIIASRLREDGIYKQIPVTIGVAFGVNKDDALKNAYADAKVNLEKLGFTEEWSKNKRRILQWKTQNPALVERAIKKAKNEGYEELETFDVRSTGRSDHVVQISGINLVEKRGVKDSKRTLLSSGTGIDEQKAIENALKEFLKAQPNPSLYV